MKATKQTIGVILGVFLVQIIGATLLGILSQGFFVLEYPLLSDPWTLILSVYSHAGFGHLVSNLIGLVVLGIIVESVTNAKRFHAFFVTTGVLAGLAQVAYNVLFASPEIGVLGASGAIFALMGYAVIGNDLADTFIDYLDLSKRGTIFLIVSLGIFITLMTGGQGVALVAHATGFILGATSGYFRLLHTE